MRFKPKIKYINLIGLLLLFVVVYYIGPIKIVESFYDLDLFYLALSVFMILPVALIKITKWHLILGFSKIKFSFKQSAIMYLIGLYFGFLTPGRLGELVKVAYLKRKAKLSLALATVVLDRFVDVLVLMFFVLFAVFYLSSYLDQQIVSVILVLFLVFVMGIVLFFKKKIVVKILRPFYLFLLPKKYKSKVRNYFDEFYSGLHLFVRNKTAFSTIFVINIFIWFLMFLQGYVMLLALKINIGFFYWLAVAPIVLIITLLPVTVSGIGTREVSLLFFLSIVGVEAQKVIAFSLLSMFLTNVVYIIMGGLLVGVTSLKKEILIPKDEEE